MISGFIPRHKSCNASSLCTAAEGAPLAYHLAASLVRTPHVEVHCLSMRVVCPSFAVFHIVHLHERFAEPADLLARVKEVVDCTGAKVVLPVTQRRRSG